MSFLDLFRAKKEKVLPIKEEPDERKQEIRKVIDGIEVLWFPYNLLVGVKKENEDYYLTASMPVKDREDGRDMQITSTKFVRTTDGESEIVKSIFDMLENLLVHELKERFMYKGERVIDPHNKDEV